MRSESDIERRHRLDAVASGWLVVKFERVTPNGFPDRGYFKDGRTVLIEWKRPGCKEQLSPQQKLRIRELRMQRIEVYVVDSIVDANLLLGIGYGS